MYKIILIVVLLLLDSSLNAQPMTDFESRCFHPDVILCDPLDTDGPWGDAITADTPHADGLPFGGRYGDWRWVQETSQWGPITPAVMDSEIKASGTGSLKFTIPSQSGSGTSGYFQTNFTPDGTVQFGEGETFFVQWRQRFSYDMLFDEFGNRREYAVTSGQGGFKTLILTAGDTNGEVSNSCQFEHLVLNNRAQKGYPTMYHSCYDFKALEKWLGSVKGSYQFNRQPSSESICYRLHPVTGKGLGAGGAEEFGDCIMFYPDEWITFQIQVVINSWNERGEVRLWIARESEPSKLAIDAKPILRKPKAPFHSYGKVWLLPYHTSKDWSEVHPEAHTWYDELIVSRSKIPDPMADIDLECGP